MIIILPITSMAYKRCDAMKFSIFVHSFFTISIGKKQSSGAMGNTITISSFLGSTACSIIYRLTFSGNN